MSPRREPSVCGIDPGSVSGAIAFFAPNYPHIVTAENLPVVDKMIDASALRDRLLQLGPDIVVLEQVASRPGQGGSSIFKFGMAYGIIWGVVAALEIPMHLVTPQKWKKAFSLDSDKEKSRALALRYWPERASSFALKKDADRAEAALIARYGARLLATPIKVAA